MIAFAAAQTDGWTANRQSGSRSNDVVATSADDAAADKDTVVDFDDGDDDESDRWCLKMPLVGPSEIRKLLFCGIMLPGKVLRAWKFLLI